MSVIRLAYLDSSALLKVVLNEPESAAMWRYLQRVEHPVSSVLLRTETFRVAGRASHNQAQLMTQARQQLRNVALIDLDRSLMEQAGFLQPSEIPTLDAIHLAAALSLGPDLDEFVTYDQRLAHAADVHGLTIVSPS